MPYCASGRSEIASRKETPTWQRTLPGLVISLTALVVIVSLIDLRKVWQALRQAQAGFLLLALAAAVTWLVVRGFVWRTLLQEKASYRDVFLTLNEGYLLNNLLPFRLGEVGRAFLLGRKAHLDFWQVVPSILIERTIDLALAVGIFLSTLPFVVGVAWARSAALVTGAVMLAGLVFLYILARNRQRVMRLVERAAGRRVWLQKLTGQRMAAFFDGLAILTSAGRFLRALGWMTCNWLVSWAQFYFLLRAFFPQATPLWGAFTLGAGALGIAAPSSPGALGVFEAALVGALAAFKADTSTATAFALVTHLFNYLTTGVFGGYALYRDGETLSGLYDRLRRQKPEQGGDEPE